MHVLIWCIIDCATKKREVFVTHIDENWSVKRFLRLVLSETLCRVYSNYFRRREVNRLAIPSEYTPGGNGEKKELKDDSKRSCSLFPDIFLYYAPEKKLLMIKQF